MPGGEQVVLISIENSYVRQKKKKEKARVLLASVT